MVIANNFGTAIAPQIHVSHLSKSYSQFQLTNTQHRISIYLNILGIGHLNKTQYFKSPSFGLHTSYY